LKTFEVFDVVIVFLLKKEEKAFIGCSVGMKLSIRQVCGSEFRARWHDVIKDSCRAGKSLKMSILPKM
jgi:hypothetical protein